MTQREWDRKVTAELAARIALAEGRYARAKLADKLDALRCSAAYVRSKRCYRDSGTHRHIGNIPANVYYKFT